MCIMLKKLSLNFPKIVFLSIFFSGCAMKKNIMGERFEFTESPCLDGIVLNISNASCSSLYTGRDPDTGGIRMRCTLSKENNAWTEKRFYILPNQFDFESQEWMPFCSDHFGTIYVELK